MVRGKLFVQSGKVREYDLMRTMASDLKECDVLDWWNLNMGFKVDDEQ